MEYFKKPKEGDERPFYWDWQNQKELLGTIRLIEYRRSGNTFLPTVEESQKVPKVFGYDLWMAKVKALTSNGDNRGYNVNTEYLLKVPYYAGIGKRALREPSTPSMPSEKLKPDSFLKVNGKQIY